MVVTRWTVFFTQCMTYIKCIICTIACFNSYFSPFLSSKSMVVFVYCSSNCPRYPANVIQMGQSAWTIWTAINTPSISRQVFQAQRFPWSKFQLSGVDKSSYLWLNQMTDPCVIKLTEVRLKINQSSLFLIKHYIINALSAVQWNTHISLNTYIYIYSEIQHTYKHSYKAAISAHIQCFYFRHTHSHTRGRCERPVPSLYYSW